MSSSIVSPYRVLPANLPDEFQISASFEFTSSGIDPGVRNLGAGEFSLGTDSDWNPDLHNLQLMCVLEGVAGLAVLFDEGGVASADAELLLALEWTSQDSGWRTLSPPLSITKLGLTTAGKEVKLTLELLAGTARGAGAVAVQLFLGSPGSVATSDAGVARIKGVRLGQLSGRTNVYIDGEGSLFPVHEEALGRNGALWEMRSSWSDPRDEPFMSEYVTLVLNRDHESFAQLRDRSSGQSRQTPLMRQVVSAWIAILVHEVRSAMENDFDILVNGTSHLEDFASIAEAAASFVRNGDLDTSSIHSLFASTQRWLDHRVEETEVVK